MKNSIIARAARAIAILLFSFSFLDAFAQPKWIGFCGSAENDLIIQLKREGYGLKRFTSESMAVDEIPVGGALLLLADGYPRVGNHIDTSALAGAAQKKIKLYIEYAPFLPGVNIRDSIRVTNLERIIVNTTNMEPGLKPMDLLGCNDCHFYPAIVDKPLLLLGTVAGFDKAEYGIQDIERFPLLFEKNNMLIATSKLSNFNTGRYGPAASWKALWEYITGWLTGDSHLHFDAWSTDVRPAYDSSAKLPDDARKISVARGVQWFFNGRFFVDDSWKKQWLTYQGDGTAPFGPPVNQQFRNGDGSLGILEGHASRIYFDGTEQYRYWIRNDVQGEVSFALAAGGHLLRDPAYFRISKNLGDFVFHHSNLRGGAKSNPDSAVFGLVGWSVTHAHVFYNDDNARSMLGLIGASAYGMTGDWDKEIAENILANLRTSSRQGFQGERLEQQDIQKNGWRYYGSRDLVNPHPHFESWMWACYLWLYDKTGYAPLLEKAKMAIRLTMEAYPDKWKWTNGIQQERARMILPLAWLVRVEDTPEHRAWLDRVVSKLLESQVSTGAIREELGAGGGMFGGARSNREYGLYEAPLIFRNGDEVADMLYTSNFAFFALNEAAQATGNKRYKDAVMKLSDFLTRIQVRSDRHPDIDGAWFRAFDFGRWDYWASNADLGWGAWSTLTGWIQSWIVATQVLVQEQNSYWNLTKNSSIKKYMPEVVKLMNR